MASNPFDDLDQPSPQKAVLPIPPAPGPNPFDDLPATSVKASQALGLPPATAADRLQAAETGPLKAAAGILSSIPDVFPNIFGLGTSAYDAYQHFVKGKDWADLPRPNAPNPVYRGLTGLMDKSPITTTQVNRPDDTASRYLSTGAEAALGGLRAVLPALAGQAAYESKPFKEDWENQLLGVGTQALAGSAQPFGPKIDRPGFEVSNENVRKGQAMGFEYPPATTNPTSATKLLETTAGKTNVQQHAAIHNQPLVDSTARTALDLPGEGPLSKEDFNRIRREEAPHYNAIRQAGPIQLDTPEYRGDVQGAMSTFSGASKVSPTLAKNDLGTIVQETLSQPVHDAGDLLDTVGMLRDKAKTAFRAGDNGNGAAYNGVAKAIEDQVDRHLSSQGGQSQELIQNFRDARARLARAHTVEDHWDSSTGHVDAASLHQAKENGQYMDGPLADLADAAGVAPKAFKPTTSSPASNHLGMWSTLAAGAGEMAGHVFGGHGVEGAIAAAALPAAYHGARSGARAAALGPLGQHYAVARVNAPLDPTTVLANFLTAQGRANPGKVPGPTASQ